ncbi:MAG: hypothetical protein A3A80_00265 [Candidatus Terrybacteria bacterium RIFCSPLOWO2_01_FULL_44_24]|uniref:Uncharacterized protein n=1 Tax=Candidatus Terrybacteria bacterium RIFCSPHIGHO2_01_FULL_43_35 TaxID=1802361 RepID=A0A1G2PCB8_9BACT|nr:MAG: hypothetical protein A2828_01005 [Candidatus Terrybacteria bacterium RIFCSPHIGHO2_01_FULL_43_35]OHA50126.1 MAG: hypothetical protein A3B75_01275 [Candidatus Terrybacteria bacterium RIFCSPHIGHO2_02_FULL_43_14]OHA51949.1 MAG: hypothetical protein A3A80_00265 [Candidatus Terrybacteria bacterium RIFCSPLOWO2_01_FULL_44_24]
MQRKFLNQEELKEYLSEREEIVFIDSSPAEAITLPPRSLAAAFHIDKVYGAQSTLYVMRHDSNDTVALNIDAYSFRTSSEEKIELDGPFKPAEYHHVDDIPSFLRVKAPQKYIDRLKEIKEGNFSDTNFL